MPKTFATIVGSVLNVIELIIPVIFSGLVIFLTWKVFDSWVINAAVEGKREEGRQYATTAVLVFVLMIIALGIVGLIQDTFFAL